MASAKKTTNSTSGGIFSAACGMKTIQTVHNNLGGNNVEQSKTVVIDTVTYEVSRVFAGKRSSRDLLKCQILATVASLTQPDNTLYNGVSKLGCGKEVT